MSKLTDLELRLIYSKAFDKQFAKGIVPAGVAALRAIEAAATEPLLQRITELERQLHEQAVRLEGYPEYRVDS